MQFSLPIAPGYQDLTQVQQGSTNNLVTLTKTEYAEKTIGSGETATTIYPVTKQKVYRNDVPSTENGIGFPQGDFAGEPRIRHCGPLDQIHRCAGTVTTYAYDEVTGVQTSMVQNSGTGGLNLTTTMTNDDLGRQTESLGPAHDINGQSLRIANWTVYQDADGEVWSGRGYLIGSSYTLVNPVSIQKLDKNGRVFSSIQATRGSGVENSGKLSPSDTFPR